MDKFQVTIKNPETNEEHSIEIQEFVAEKGRGAGRAKLFPANFSKMTVADYVKYWGEKAFLKRFVIPRAKQLFTTFTDEATTKETVVDGKIAYVPETDESLIQKTFGEMLSVLSPRGETISDLTKRLFEILNEELPSALDNDDFVSAKELNAEMRELRAQIKAKKQKPEVKEDTADVDDDDAPKTNAAVVA